MTRYARSTNAPEGGRSEHSATKWSDLKIAEQNLDLKSVKKKKKKKVAKTDNPEKGLAETDIIEEKVGSSKADKFIAKDSTPKKIKKKKLVVEQEPPKAEKLNTSDLAPPKKVRKKKKKLIKDPQSPNSEAISLGTVPNSEPNGNDETRKSKKRKIFIEDEVLYKQESWKDLQNLLREYRGKGLAESEKCFQCRQPGHRVADCPEPKKYGTGICFKCSSTEHSVHECRSKVKGYPYAACFICGLEGHLSRDCTQNPHGIFPDGGECHHCSKRGHKAIDCPSLREKSGNKETVAARLSYDNKFKSADHEEIEDNLQGMPVKKKTKIVKF